MIRHEQEEELLKQLKIEEAELHELLVSVTHELRIARQHVVDIETRLQKTMARLNHVRRQMDLLWQSAP
jgi:predicted  nucleic acid-binding Zn-ribbon protein